MSEDKSPEFTRPTTEVRYDEDAVQWVITRDPDPGIASWEVTFVSRDGHRESAPGEPGARHLFPSLWFHDVELTWMWIHPDNLCHVSVVRKPGSPEEILYRDLSPEHGCAECRATIGLVHARDIGDHLAKNRPPECRSLSFTVPAHDDDGAAAHPLVMRTLLTEILAMWPAGTALRVDYPNGRYVQGLFYPPAYMTELGPAADLDFSRVARAPWHQPDVTPTHPEFASQPVWSDNPVREWLHPTDRPRFVGAFVAGAVYYVLKSTPGSGYTVTIFVNGPADDHSAGLNGEGVDADAVPGRPTSVPRPMDGESHDAYRAGLRAWFDAIPSTNTAGFQRTEWEYICSFAGVQPE